MKDAPRNERLSNIEELLIRRELIAQHHALSNLGLLEMLQ